MGVRGRNSDNTMIRAKLGWAPTISIRSGLEVGTGTHCLVFGCWRVVVNASLLRSSPPPFSSSSIVGRRSSVVSQVTYRWIQSKVLLEAAAGVDVSLYGSSKVVIQTVASLASNAAGGGERPQDAADDPDKVHLKC